MTVRPSIGGEKAHSARFSIVARVILLRSHPWCHHFFFPPPFFPTTTTGSSRGRRNIFFRGYGCAPTRGMRRGSSVESFLMTERNDSSNLMEEGRTTTPSNFSLRTFLTSWLISPPSHTHTHIYFFFNVIDRPIELLWGKILTGNRSRGGR